MCVGWWNDVMFFFSGTIPEDGVPDMTRLTVLDEEVINKNLRVRYENDRIYVSFSVKIFNVFIV